PPPSRHDRVARSGSLIHCRQGYFGRSWNGVVPLGPFTPMPYPQAYAHPELAGAGAPVRPASR
ncbi:MAG TPA: hypothetical protein VKP01_05830, partial [Saliniramus sp.]|nr:hypothetical protein [Saliniramus sp.]